MKIKFLFLIIVMISNISFGQKKNRVKIEYSYLNSMFFEHEDEGYAVYSEPFAVNKIGLSYNRKLYKWLRVETGFDFAFSNYSTKFEGIPNFYERSDKFYMISFPMVLSIEFAKYFYVKGGMSIDFQTNDPEESDKQSGIGGIFGFGAKYDYQDYTFSIGLENQRRRMKSFTELDVWPNYLHHYGVTLSFGYNF